MTGQTHAVLGTGMVGKAIASKLISLGHHVGMGSRRSGNPDGLAWAKEAGERASASTFGEVSTEADVIWLAVKGEHALPVVEAAGDALDAKLLLDLTNPLDFSQGFPPRLSICNDDSLGEQIQRAAPRAHVVKALNTLSNVLMVDPGRLGEPTDVFIAGNDLDAKAKAVKIIESLGHSTPIDMGEIQAARALEAWLLLWTRLYGVFGNDRFNLKLVRGD